MAQEKLLTIGEAGKSLGRSPHTLRTWERTILPVELRPQRNSRNERLYSLELVEHIREWMIAVDQRRGSNIDRAREIARSRAGRL